MLRLGCVPLHHQHTHTYLHVFWTQVIAKTNFDYEKEWYCLSQARYTELLNAGAEAFLEDGNHRLYVLPANCC